MTNIGRGNSFSMIRAVLVMGIMIINITAFGVYKYMDKPSTTGMIPPAIGDFGERGEIVTDNEVEKGQILFTRQSTTYISLDINNKYCGKIAGVFVEVIEIKESGLKDTIMSRLFDIVDVGYPLEPTWGKISNTRVFTGYDDGYLDSKGKVDKAPCSECIFMWTKDNYFYSVTATAKDKKNPDKKLVFDAGNVVATQIIKNIESGDL